MERFSQTLIGRIRRLLVEGRFTSWEQTLPEAVKAIRATQNSITNYTPEEVWNRNLTLRTTVRDHMDKIRQLANDHLHLRSRACAVGDHVWLWDSERLKQYHKKFAPFWLERWKIVEQVSHSVRRIQSSKRYTRLVHSDML